MHHHAPRPLLNAALAAAERGWHVFPLLPGAKQPAIRSWESRATTSPRRVRRCWTMAPYNIGIATGPSCLIVVDLDVPKHRADVPPAGTPASVTDGADALAVLAEAYAAPYPTDTYTVHTPTGGTHLYFTAPADVELRNTAATLGWKIDTRAHGGYVVAAGSTINGRPYNVVHDAPPAPLPQWLVTLLTPKPLPPQAPLTVPLLAEDRHGRYLNAAVRAEIRRVRTAHPGQRNNALYIAAVALGQLVAGGELTKTEVTNSLTPAALHAGLPERDTHRTIASGLRAGAKKPRSIERRTAA
ncbi:bifunctional DNA primase/polymerase [Streptomyces odontomachi]|uniref:bifunctional DNA primase/polymerase n=1 Tax=Streptomyces odontomachi TaxID=2944940 RepID=UPI00210C04D0|nr:bifunctional DNA primase/polymerase [Streptomyces sp. ODS25]